MKAIVCTRHGSPDGSDVTVLRQPKLERMGLDVADQVAAVGRNVTRTGRGPRHERLIFDVSGSDRHGRVESADEALRPGRSHVVHDAV
jgi:ribosomal protein L18